MRIRMTRKLAAGAVGLAAVGGAAGAYAATSTGPGAERQAFLNDAARRLDVSPQKLGDALRGAFEDRLDAAVKAGRLTQEQADAIKQRLERHGGLPPIGAPGPLFHHHFLGPFRAGLKAAARYLRLEPADLRSKLRSGKTLAQVARDRGKSVSGLEEAIVDAVKARLDRAVKNGRLTAAQEKRIVSALREHVDELVRDAGPPRLLFREHGGWRGLRGPDGPGMALPGGAPPPPPPAGGI